jgi:SnoaL-like domain
MTDHARIRELMLVNLFAVFSERDPERRLKAIAANYTEDVIWSDPEGTLHGHEALDNRAQELLDGMPDFVFTAAGRSWWFVDAAVSLGGS